MLVNWKSGMLMMESHSYIHLYNINGLCYYRYSCTCTRDKLCAYARNQLPGSKYWEPKDIHTKGVLYRLKPNNAVCESILRLNDYLITALPNMKQVTKSNMVTVKKTKQWSSLMH